MPANVNRSGFLIQNQSTTWSPIAGDPDPCSGVVRNAGIIGERDVGIVGVKAAPAAVGAVLGSSQTDMPRGRFRHRQADWRLKGYRTTLGRRIGLPPIEIVGLSGEQDRPLHRPGPIAPGWISAADSVSVRGNQVSSPAPAAMALQTSIEAREQ
jgi:hypothetical protein